MEHMAMLVSCTVVIQGREHLSKTAEVKARKEKIEMLYLVCVLLPLLAMVQSDVMDRSQLQSLQRTMQTAINNKIRGELDESVSVMETLKADLETCSTVVETRQSTCQTCANQKCQPGVAAFFGGIWTGSLNFFKGIGSQFVSWSGFEDMGDFFQNAGSWFSGAANSALNWSGWNAAGDWFSDAGGSITSGLNSVGNWFSDAGSSIADSFSSVGNTISGWFGKRRRRSVSVPQIDVRTVSVLRRRFAQKQTRALDPKVRDCMSKCDSCSPFITENTNYIIGEICGDELLVRNQTMANTMHALEALYNKNAAGPMVTRIEYSMSNMNMATFSISPITVTAVLPDNSVAKYSSNVPFYPMSVSRTATELADEIYREWGL